MDQELAGPENGSERPTGPLEVRDAKLANVDYPKREISVIVMPYDETAHVEHRGRMIKESVAPGSFKGIQRRLHGRGRIMAYRDHDTTKLCGKVIRLYPERSEGLVADIKMAPNDLGKETLELADEGYLGASAGFQPLENGEEWPNRNERRLTRVYLGHVAFVGEPAFEGAQVLAVRSADLSPTPYRDELEAWMLSQQYGKLHSSR
jgi:HK97 family phage prohead protease